MANNMERILKISTCILSLLTTALTQDGPIVETIYGAVLGSTVATHYNDGTLNVNSFYGIPFAASTGGAARFERPVPPEPWDGILNTTSSNGLPAACTQGRAGVTVITHPLFDNFGEDCLNLNLFAPEDLEPEAPYPVMVYFYGGAYTSGSNIMYPGHFLAARDVIVIVINYRVSIFGFLNTEGNTYANAAFYDQRLSLEWVRDNIGAFGGNPDQVTIFGQSAGASSAALHTVSPGSRDLFHAVLQQSGCDTTFWAVNWPQQRPYEYTRQTAVKLNCPTEPDDEMIACLKAADEWELQGNWSIQCTPGHFCQGHGPVIDGPGGFLPDHPLVMRENDDFSKVPLLSGYNSEDGSIYVIWMIPESLEGGFNRSEFQFMLYDRFVSIWAPQLTPNQTADAYWATDFFYSPWPHIDDEDLNRLALIEMTTDAAWGYPQDRQLKLHSSVAPSFWYIFGYRSDNASSGIFEGTEWAGVPHMGELPYVWGWTLLKLAPEVRRDSRILVDIIDWNDEDFEYAEFTMDLFTNFVKYFDPTPEPVDGPIDHGPISWPALQEDELNYLWIENVEIEPRINYRQKHHAFFTEYIEYITGIEIMEKSTPSGETYKGLNSAFLERGFQKQIYSILKDVYPLEMVVQLLENYESVMKTEENMFI